MRSSSQNIACDIFCNRISTLDDNPGNTMDNILVGAGAILEVWMLGNYNGRHGMNWKKWGYLN